MKFAGMSQITGDPPAADDAILCFVNVRNEDLRLPYLLDYHRRLGIDHFVIVDNASDDGTVDFLSSQNDVTLYETSESFSESRCGLNWLEALRNRYGTDRWCVTIDADELLVFPFCEEGISLRVFTEHLDDIGAEAVLALLVDCYPSGPLRDAEYERGMPFETSSPFFDVGPYYLAPNPERGLVGVFGGPRYRAFYDNGKKGRGPVLRKVPLVKWVRGAVYTSVNHAVGRLRFAPTTGVVLHYKFLHRFTSLVDQILAHDDRGPGHMYSAAQEAMLAEPALTLMNEASERYQGSSQLFDKQLLHIDPAWVRAVARHIRRRGDAQGAADLTSAFVQVRRRVRQEGGVPISHLVGSWADLSNR